MDAAIVQESILSVVQRGRFGGGESRASCGWSSLKLTPIMP